MSDGTGRLSAPRTRRKPIVIDVAEGVKLRVSAGTIIEIRDGEGVCSWTREECLDMFPDAAPMLRLAFAAIPDRSR